MQNNYFKFENLPIEIFEKIYFECINVEECDLVFNKNLRLICKYWNKVINKKKYWELYSKKIFFKNNRKNISVYNFISKFINRNKILLKTTNNFQEKKKIIIENNILKKIIENDYFILKTHVRKYLNYKIPSNLFFFNQMNYAFNPDNLNNINILSFPVNYFKNSKCIDNLCGIECSSNYHGLLDYTKHYISRGIDDKGRVYLLFFYKNSVTNRIYYEFIFTFKLGRDLLFTYSGLDNVCYIGNISYNNNEDLNNNIFLKRIIGNKSLNYIQRLLNFKKCGPVFFNEKTNTYSEYEYYDDINEDDSDNNSDSDFIFEENELLNENNENVNELLNENNENVNELLNENVNELLNENNENVNENNENVNELLNENVNENNENVNENNENVNENNEEKIDNTKEKKKRLNEDLDIYLFFNRKEIEKNIEYNKYIYS